MHERLGPGRVDQVERAGRTRVRSVCITHLLGDPEALAEYTAPPRTYWGDEAVAKISRDLHLSRCRHERYELRRLRAWIRQSPPPAVLASRPNTRQRAPRRHASAATTNRGGDSGDDSEPPGSAARPCAGGAL